MQSTTNNIDLNIELWPKQMEALQSKANELMFGGASEGGKSHFLRVIASLLCLDIPNFSGVLIRKKYSDILENHLRGEHGFPQLLKPLIDAGEVRVTQEGIKFLKNNSYLAFQHCQDDRQFTSAQGVERDGVFIDEATQIPERLLKIFRAWCRMSKEKRAKVPEQWKHKVPFMLYTCNPVGASLGYFRRQFVKCRSIGAIEYVDGFQRQFIKSLASDNKSVDLEVHKARLQGIGDAALAKALDEGDWDAPLGDFYPEWDESRHVIPDFTPPAHWYRYRAFDWGSADPFAVYWIAVSDGDMFETEYWTYDQGFKKVRGKLWFPRGAKIFYREWYGCREDDPAKGLGLRNADIAKGIIERSPGAEERSLITLTDSFVFPDRGEEGGQTIAKTFADCGVPLTLGNTSRVTGWATMRDNLIGVRFDLNSPHRDPMMYVCEGCKYLRDYIPALPRHPNEAKRHEDAAESGEATHACDAARLANMATPRVKDAPTPDPARIQAQVIAATTYQPTFGDAVKLLQQQKARSGGRHF